MGGFERELEIGIRIARAAGQVASRYWEKGVAFESKPDLSPVTVADRDSERLISQLIEETFPGDGVLGEEGACRETRNGRRWIVDPVDGTRDFVRGNPSWAVLIGFEAADEVEVGIAYLPAMGDLFFASRGGGAFVNDRAIRVSRVDKVAEAVLCLNDFAAVARCAFASGLMDWMRQFFAVRSMGGCLDAVMVARGQADVWIDPSGAPWDFAALKVIIEEAGGRFFNFDGGRSIHGGNCVFAAPGLEAEARRFVCGVR